MGDAFSKCQTVTTPDGEVVDVHPFYRAIDERLADGRVRIDGRTVLMAGSNDYLSLSRDPRLQAAAIEAVRSLGVGNSGSRPANGTLALHELLESRLAGFLGMEAVMVVSTGYQANLALHPLFGPNDALFADRQVHASVIDATLLGQAPLRRYRHNDMGHLGRLLDAAAPGAGRVILTEGMFSLNGDLCDLPATVELARRYDARLIVDSAHDVGLLGPGGRGVTEHFGHPAAVDVQTLTFSKCFGTLGGAVAGPRHVIDHLRHHARPALFSASLPAPCAAAALTALDIIAAEPERRQRVLAGARWMRATLAGLGFDTSAGFTPAIPVPVRDARLCLRLWTELFDEGVFTNAMIPPGVPEGKALIRLSVTADHTEADLARIAEAFAAAGRRLGLVPTTANRDAAAVRTDGQDAARTDVRSDGRDVAAVRADA
ncbi:aminotransferase class I/II-fold pyridoxal phosphate-dependent enzyme [Nonomuraea sp. NPDC002799]